MFKPADTLSKPKWEKATGHRPSLAVTLEVTWKE